MKRVKELIDTLNPIYYEYDEKSYTLIRDKNFSDDKIITPELISITHKLNQHNIYFFVDGNKSIVLKQNSSIISKIEASVLSFFKKMFGSSNIYILGDKKVKGAKNLPLFEIKKIATKIDINSYEALVFTSKNGIYAIDEIDSKWKKLPSYVIAPQSAKVVKSLGGNLKYVGKSKHGNEFATELIEHLKGKKVLYVRGSKVVSNLTQILNEHGVVCDEAIVYESVCREFDTKIALPENSAIIFSSPSMIECFFKNSSWDDSYKAIAIGNTTSAYFPSHIKVFIADTTSMESCVRKAKEVLSQ